MRLKLSIISVVAIILVGMLFGCSDSPTDPKPLKFEYPLEVGNYWNYENKYYYCDIEPDSIVHRFTDTTYTTDEVIISRLDSLADSTPVYVFDEIHSVGNKDSVLSSAYYQNQSDGLYYYGSTYKNYATPKLSSFDYSFGFNGLRFSSGHELLNYIRDGMLRTGQSLGISEIIEDPPLKVIDNSFEVGAQWVFWGESKPFQIIKEIDTIQILESTTGQFECARINWIYENDYISRVDYVSQSGLVKRLISIKNIIVINPNGRQAGTVTLTEEYNLKDYSIIR